MEKRFFIANLQIYNGRKNGIQNLNNKFRKVWLPPYMDGNCE
jgi:hypothetical protein